MCEILRSTNTRVNDSGSFSIAKHLLEANLSFNFEKKYAICTNSLAYTETVYIID